MDTPCRDDKVPTYRSYIT